MFIERKHKWLTAYSVLVCMTLMSCKHDGSEHATVPSTTTVAAAEPAQINPSLWPKITSQVKKDPAIEARIQELLAQLTLKEKVGQLIQPELRNITPEDITRYSIGSVLNGGGSFPGGNKNAKLAEWIALADGFYKASMSTEGGRTPIPVMWGTDAVHGHNNVIGATLFPHNIALGATRNPDLIQAIGVATAEEIAVTGIDWSFAPTLAVVRDDRWGRTYESYSEDPAVVQSYAGKMVLGLQGIPNAKGDNGFLSEQRVIATAKHFLGDGGTLAGVDRANNDAFEADLIRLHAAGYVTALEAGAQTVMASFNSWQNIRMHGSHDLLTRVLKEQMGFDGLVVGDWSGHGFIPGCTTVNCPQAINAGLDVFMAPDPNWKELYNNTLAQAKNGTISEARLNDAVARILRVKLRANLFEKGVPSSRALAGKREVIGSAEHRAIARQAVRESLVLLKNNAQVLPINPRAKVLVAGDGADSIGKQSGGWSITWQGTDNANSDFPGATSIYKGIADVVNAAGGSVQLNVEGVYQQKPDVAIVVFGEDPYAEMQGDVNTLGYHNAKNLALLKRLKADGIKVVSLFITGRPLWINPFINASDAFVVIWQPGTEGAGVSDVIFATANGKTKYDFVGKLSFSWPSDPAQTPLNLGQANYQPQFIYGYGLQYQQPSELAVLSENIHPVDQSSEPSVLPIFKQRTITPWQLVMFDDLNNYKTITSSRAELKGISVTAVDKEVQEDARHIVWNGDGKASVSFVSTQRTDLTGYAKQKGALLFDIKVAHKAQAPVTLSVECGTDCGAMVNITKEINQAPMGEWARITVPLSCFDGGIAKLDMVLAPFTMSSQGALAFTLYNLRIEKNVELTTCPEIVQKGHQY